MDCGDGCIPIRSVCDEIFPEFGGRELWRYNNGTPRVQRCEEPGEEAVDMEEGHDEHGAVRGRQGVGCLDVLHCPCQVSVRQRHCFRSGGRSQS